MRKRYNGTIVYHPLTAKPVQDYYTQNVRRRFAFVIFRPGLFHPRHLRAEGWHSFLKYYAVQLFFHFKLTHMLRWTVIFLVVAIIAGIFGFGGIAAGAAGIAKILFFIFIILFILSIIRGRSVE